MHSKVFFVVVVFLVFPFVEKEIPITLSLLHPYYTKSEILRFFVF